MPYTPRTRNRYQLLVATATGVTACAAGATTGAIAAVASQAMADEAAQNSAQESARQGDRRPVVWKKRPLRTLITTRVLPAASPGVVAVGGGTVTPASTPPATSGSGGSSGSGSSGGQLGSGTRPRTGALERVVMGTRASAGYGVRRWEAWSTYVYVGVSDAAVAEHAEHTARRLLHAIDVACSRFRADSDLTRANRQPGRWVEVDPLLVAAVRVALAAARTTGGLVSPCLGRSLVSLGYDADLRRLERRAVDVLPPPPPTRGGRSGSPTRRCWCRRAATWTSGRPPRRGPPTCSPRRLAEDTGCRVLVSLGGDVRVAGAGEPWPVRVTERPDAGPSQVIGLTSGGLATSSTLVRRWHSQHGEMHHVVDPRTGRPVAGVLRTVTALGETVRRRQHRHHRGTGPGRRGAALVVRPRRARAARRRRRHGHQARSLADGGGRPDAAKARCCGSSTGDPGSPCSASSR